MPKPKIPIHQAIKRYCKNNLNITLCIFQRANAVYVHLKNFRTKGTATEFSLFYRISLTNWDLCGVLFTKVLSEYLKDQGGKTVNYIIFKHNFFMLKRPCVLY